MRLTVGIDSAIASARLWALMLRIRDPSRLYKVWGVRVMNQARANARARVAPQPQEIGVPEPHGEEENHDAPRRQEDGAKESPETRRRVRFAA